MNFIKQYPTATAGLALGLSTILLVWSDFPMQKIYSNSLLVIGFALGLLLILPLITKFCISPRFLLDDLKDPTIGSVAPTLTLTMMILSFILGKLSIDLGIVIWCVAVIAHLYFLTIFACHRYRQSECFQSHILPSWFVPSTGLIVACITMPDPFFMTISKLIFIFGTACYVILMPLVLYRLCLGNPLKEGHKPTLALLTTPSNLILAGCVTLYPHANPLFVVSLFGISCLTSLSVYVMLVTLLKIKFTPAFAAFTFPLAVAGEATLDLSHWVSKYTLLAPYAHDLYILGVVQLIIASCVALYVAYHFFNFFRCQSGKC